VLVAHGHLRRPCQASASRSRPLAWRPSREHAMGGVARSAGVKDQGCIGSDSGVTGRLGVSGRRLRERRRRHRAGCAPARPRLKGRFLGFVATRGRVDQAVSSLCRRSAGVSQSSVLRGRPFSSAATVSRWSRAWAERSVPFLEVLPEQAIGVFVRASLPGAGWVAEVDRHVGGEAEGAMGSHL
jgi:hypothetical protein